ncbi:MAG: type IV toxin-antitoxin system AbiEi family antitoxin domain-containing protein [Actinobacteria bacterium]|nr:type IV toxin-antitoxin system AbiEi family antitoxin domain-containing protein [Actinomycetota bacterium]
MGDEGLRVGHEALADLATTQHGVVATWQLADLGYGRNAVAKAAKVGRLHRVHRGVYVVGQRGITWEGRCMAAVLASYPSVASHLAAARLWGLLRYRPETMHITRRSPHPRKRPFVVHTADLARADLARRDHIPVTSLSRTVLDVAVTSRPRTVRRHLQLADDLKIFDLREMEDLLERTKGHKGQAKVRAALDIADDRPVFTRSGLEERFLELMREAGLPEPAMNLFVEGFEIDAYWADHRFGVELDVYETHGSRLSFEEDRERDDALLLAGIETTRVTGPRLDREPGAVVDSVRRHLARRAGG